MIKILHLIDQYNIGGPGKTIINTAKYIDNNKFKIFVGTFVKKNKTTELVEALKENNINVLELEDTRGLSCSNLVKILKYININEIKIIHSHGYKSDIYTIIIILILGSRIVSLTTHHGWIKNKFGQTILGKVSLYGAFLLDHTIIVNELMKNNLPVSMVRHNKFSILHNSIVVDDYKRGGDREFMRKKMNIKNEDVLLLSVGRLSPEKGCVNLIDAFARVRKVEKNVKLIFVGDGPLMNSLLKYVAERKLSECIFFLGHFKKVQQFYESADIFICPSDTEGLSNAILESMAYSLPVIATNVGGNPEIITDGVNGILIPSNDSCELSIAILKLFANPSMRDFLGSNGYKTIESKFSFDERTAKLQELYINLVCKKFGSDSTSVLFG